MEMKKEGDEGDPSLTLVHLKQDAFSVLSSIKHEKKLRLMKTRWLMGVPKNFKLSRGSFNDLRKPIFSADMYLPEPFLRNDSVFSEVAKGYLVNCFSPSKKDQPVGNFVKEFIFPFNEDVAFQRRQCSLVHKVFLPMLDDLNINSLCFLADLVTRKSVKFEKSRPRLESVIKRYLPKIFEQPSLFEDALGLQTQIMEVFKDPKNFRENTVPRLSKTCTSYRCDVDMVLEKLEGLSLHALDAIRRKLCMCPSSLYEEPCTNRNKKQLIGTLRRKIEKLIGDGMPQNLARALRVASLSVKLMNGHFDSTLPEFLEVPHEIEALQNEILKAVWSVPNLPPDEVKKLQSSLDLDGKVKRNRSQIKNLLTECLFQCDELKIPESILRAISTINSYGGEKNSKETIEDELICMLNMGSCMKELVWDLCEHPDIDQEFWCAYKDESEIDDSSSNDDDDDDDDDDVYDIDDKESHCSNYEKVDIPVGNESFAATHMEQQEDVSVPMRTSSITSTIPLPLENDEKCLRKEGVKNLRVMSADKSLSEEQLHVLQECCHFMPMDDPFLPKKPEYLFPTLSELAKSSLTNSGLFALQDVTGNEYLIIEGICDEVSLFAHKFIGCMMEKLIKAEGIHLDPASRLYLLGGTSVPEKQEGELQKSNVNDTGGLVFIQAVNELVPSFPKSGMRRLLEVLKQS